MAFINYASRDIQLKIVYYGPAICGKTTNLEVIHKMISMDHKGNLTSLDAAQDRTLFFDFMPLEANAIKGFTTKFQMYTVPGQVMYNTTRRIVLRGVDGIVFVADSRWESMEENLASLKNLEENLANQGESLDEIPYVIQYNKRDLANIAPIHYMEFLLNNKTIRRPSFPGIAVQGSGVFESLNMISRLVLNKFIKKTSGDSTSEQSKEMILM